MKKSELKEIVKKQIREIKINTPIPKFRNIQDLKKFFEDKPNIKKEFIKKYAEQLGVTDDEEWEEVFRNWYNNEIKYTDKTNLINLNNEKGKYLVFWDDEDNYLFFNLEEHKHDLSPYEIVIEMGPNSIYTLR